ncbi:MAG: thioredoxin-dependent thiol peroxidase [Pseudomonadota bacterium]
MNNTAPNATLTAGDMAPEFSLPREDGSVVASADLRGRGFVLFFYPRADTAGCTKEAVAFTGLMADFDNARVTVLGISKDTVAKQQKFATKHGLTMPLLSDADSDVSERFGTWVEKSMYGKTYMGIERATFLIDAEGRIAQIWRKVKVPGHAEAVLEVAKAL